MPENSFVKFADVEVQISFDSNGRMNLTFATKDEWILRLLEETEGFHSNGTGGGRHALEPKSVNFSAHDRDFARKYYGKQK